MLLILSRRLFIVFGAHCHRRLALEKKKRVFKNGSLVQVSTCRDIFKGTAHIQLRQEFNETL